MARCVECALNICNFFFIFILFWPFLYPTFLIYFFFFCTKSHMNACVGLQHLASSQSIELIERSSIYPYSLLISVEWSSLWFAHTRDGVWASITSLLNDYWTGAKPEKIFGWAKFFPSPNIIVIKSIKFNENFINVLENKSNLKSNLITIKNYLSCVLLYFWKLNLSIIKFELIMSTILFYYR